MMEMRKRHDYCVVWTSRTEYYTGRAVSHMRMLWHHHALTSLAFFTAKAEDVGTVYRIFMVLYCTFLSTTFCVYSPPACHRRYVMHATQDGQGISGS